MSQRKPQDRRRLVAGRSFPFTDSNGEQVLKERRKQHDRRTRGIDEAEWPKIPEQSEKYQGR